MAHLEGNRLDNYEENPITVFEKSHFANLQEKQNDKRRTTNLQDEYKKIKVLKEPFLVFVMNFVF